MLSLVCIKNLNVDHNLKGIPLDNKIWLVSSTKSELEQLIINKEISAYETLSDIELLPITQINFFNPNCEYLYAIIGNVKNVLDKTWGIYNLSTNTWEKEGQDVFLFNGAETISTIAYYEILLSCLTRAVKLGRKLIVYHAFNMQNYPVRSLLDKMINELMFKSDGTLIYHVDDDDIAKYYQVGQSIFEPYIQNAVYTQDTADVAFNRIQNLEHNLLSLKRNYRTPQSLYSDLFYTEVPIDEKIYVHLNMASPKMAEIYEQLGVKYIPLLGEGGMLYGKRSLFDGIAPQLQNYVKEQFFPRILTPPNVDYYFVNKPLEREIPQKTDCVGENVLIGVIDVVNPDLTHYKLKTPENQSRVVYMWEQTDGGEGVEYSKEEIQALSELDSNPNTDVSIGTALMLLAGGNYTQFSASKAEFISAKINSAPENLQKIYGGMPNSNAVLFEDIILAIDKLLEFALSQEKALVICLQYGSNLSSHDGTDTLEELLSLYATQPALTLLGTAGDEADKKHHQSLDVDGKNSITIKVDNETNNILGIVWVDYPGNIKVNLRSSVYTQVYNLNKPNKFVLEKGIIYTQGKLISSNNGSVYLLFRLENVPAGMWELEIEPQFVDFSKVEIWLADNRLNAKSYLLDGDAFKTIPSLGNIKGVLCVGTYDENAFTVTRSSGRGYTRSNRVVPNCIVRGVKISISDNLKNELLVSGSVASLGQMAGEVAIVYGLLKVNGFKILPNSAMMSYWLTSNLIQLDTVEYPNVSQGYGIYTPQGLRDWLSGVGIKGGDYN